MIGFTVLWAPIWNKNSILNFMIPTSTWWFQEKYTISNQSPPLSYKAGLHQVCSTSLLRRYWHRKKFWRKADKKISNSHCCFVVSIALRRHPTWSGSGGPKPSWSWQSTWAHPWRSWQTWSHHCSIQRWWAWTGVHGAQQRPGSKFLFNLNSLEICLATLYRLAEILN